MAGTPLTELNRPLGQDRPVRHGTAWSQRLGLAGAGMVGLAFLALILVLALRHDPDGGEPVATALISKLVAAKPEIAQVPLATPVVPETARPQATARQLEAESGVTVVRPGAEAPGSIIITIPESGEVKLASAPDGRLIERSRFGLLPKVGPDGATPAQIYARPLGPAPETKPAGRIALLVGGLGISQNGTAEAIAKLPGTVSLGFAPYGTELERIVQRARGDGHEVFLQVPMEPFDYPDNDPGPQTLLSGPKAAENIDRLHWLLGRFTGYVGIVNFLGGRLTADEAALSPILREIAGRGLMVIDDGSSARSLLAPSAIKAQIPTLKVDRVVDSVTRADAIDGELQKLEALARDRGVAVGSASALPVSIERIVRWAATLEGKGIVLVPVSAARGFRNPSTTGSLR
ncbi:divergent polysaccharide deacetylase family protein [Bosea caraganae]|uniref:divergent polysaccharide deacetylase family protein n=1 Tax=Bosea caraganae TaxID=2763117 RepID=UPI001FE3BAE1|nr:divergent polysaccharide deacetylase family protein [Bosea caraganae]